MQIGVSYTMVHYAELNVNMMLNATFNNISVMSWWSVLLAEETEVPIENHRSAAGH
jgi:hypothetical protein